MTEPKELPDSIRALETQLKEAQGQIAQMRGDPDAIKELRKTVEELKSQIAEIKRSSTPVAEKDSDEYDYLYDA